MAIQESSGSNGLPRLLLTHPSGSTAEVYLHGAHVTSWVPAGMGEALFLSRSAIFRADAAIRGGIPVVFPQFSDRGPLMKHGFARTERWRWVSGEEEDDAPLARLRLEDSPATREAWPHAFAAELTVRLGADHLQVGLRVENRDAAAFSFTTALHSYLRVGDVSRVEVEGLGGARFIDQVHEGAEQTQPEEALRIAGEVDRIYLDVPPTLRLRDPAAGRTLTLATSGFRDAVVWNPWVDKARALPDMQDEEYREMLCVEAARIGVPVRLEPGASWEGAQRLQMATAEAHNPARGV